MSKNKIDFLELPSENLNIQDLFPLEREANNGKQNQRKTCFVRWHSDPVEINLFWYAALKQVIQFTDI